MIGDLINSFVQSVRMGKVEVYNEFSLQHELGLFVCTHLSGYKVEFERNVSHFFKTRRSSLKGRDRYIGLFNRARTVTLRH